MPTEEMKQLCYFIQGEWRMREKYKFPCRIIIDAKAPEYVKNWENIKRIPALFCES